jgi:hypothetical protein
MAEEEEESTTVFELAESAYPDIDGVTLEERRRVWALSFILEAGKAAASAAAVVKEARVIEEFLAGKPPAVTLAKE